MAAVTQKQIAELAGVSRGTVDRVLNHRGHVNPEIEDKIRKLAEEMGYKPNKAGAQLVRMRHPVKIGVIIQSTDTDFMQMVEKEIEEIASELRAEGARLLICAQKEIDPEEQLSILEEMRQQGVEGIVLSPAADERISSKIDELVEGGIPVVTFNTDAPGTGRLCYVGQDNYQSGRACAGLLSRMLGGRGRVFVLTGDLAGNQAQKSRMQGFLSEMEHCHSGMEILPVESCKDSNTLAYEIVKKKLSEREAPEGIYIVANGHSGACRAIRELGMKGKVRVVCHDLTPQNTEAVKEGIIDFLVGQDAYVQATRPLKLLTDYIWMGEKPENEYLYTKIDYRDRYNVD